MVTQSLNSLNIFSTILGVKIQEGNFGLAKLRQKNARIVGIKKARTKRVHKSPYYENLLSLAGMANQSTPIKRRRSSQDN